MNTIHAFIADSLIHAVADKKNEDSVPEVSVREGI